MIIEKKEANKKQVVKGVYYIVNKITGDFYIGSSYSKKGIGGRNKDERADLRNDNWLCENNTKRTHIQKAWNLYGEEVFEFLIIEICPNDFDKKQIHAVEQKHIDEHWCSGKLYNMKPMATGGAGTPSQETRAKTSASGKIAQNRPEVRVKKSITWARPEVKARQKAAAKETNARPETKARRSAAAKEVQNRPDIKVRNSATQKIAQNRPEVKTKKSVSSRITYARPEVKARHSASGKIAQNRPEVRAANSAAQKKRFENPEERTKVSMATKIAMARPEVKTKICASLKEAWAHPDVKAKIVGENNSQAKLTWIQVIEIREKYAIGNITQASLVKKYNVSPGTIHGIVNHRTWKQESNV